MQRVELINTHNMKTVFLIKRAEFSNPEKVLAVCTAKKRAIEMLKSLENDPPCDHMTVFEYEDEEVYIENKHGYIANYRIEEVVMDDWADAYMV